MSTEVVKVNWINSILLTPAIIRWSKAKLAKSPDGWSYVRKGNSYGLRNSSGINALLNVKLPMAKQ